MLASSSAPRPSLVASSSGWPSRVRCFRLSHPRASSAAISVFTMAPSALFRTLAPVAPLPRARAAHVEPNLTYSVTLPSESSRASTTVERRSSLPQCSQTVVSSVMPTKRNAGATIIAASLSLWSFQPSGTNHKGFGGNPQARVQDFFEEALAILTLSGSEVRRKPRPKPGFPGSEAATRLAEDLLVVDRGVVELGAAGVALNDDVPEVQGVPEVEVLHGLAALAETANRG